MMRPGRITAVLMLAFVLSAGISAAAGETEAYTDVAVLSTTDMHGRCWETDVLTGAASVNNMLRVFTAVRGVRGACGEDCVLLIDNGDLFQGTAVSEYQILRAWDGTEPPAMALCLKEIGYTAFVPGNHEFNYPWDVMSAAYRWLEENGVPVVAANICRDGAAEGNGDGENGNGENGNGENGNGENGDGENVFAPYIVKTVTVNGHEHKIGILGLENSDITRWDQPDRYPGLRFSHPGNDAFAMAEEAALYLPRMKEAGCEFIIVSYHGGLGSADGDLVFGVNTENQVRRLIAGNRDIDLVICGHDHSAAYSGSAYPDAAGREITVVNGGGSYLTCTVFRFREDENGALTWEPRGSRDLALGDYEADARLLEKIRPYADMAEAFAEQGVGTALGDWDGDSAFHLRQTDSMDLIGKACIEMVSRRLAEKDAAFGEAGVSGGPGVDMSMMSVSVSGSYTVQAGPVSVKDIYRLYRFANDVLAIEMTGAEIRSVMEENAASRLTVRVHDGEAFFYQKGDQFTNIVFCGLNFVYDMAKPAGERVRIGGFANGRAFEDGGVYLVAVNDYLLGNGQCGLRDYSAEDCVWSLQQEEGGTVQDLIAEYLALAEAESGGVSPEAFDWRWEIDYSADPRAAAWDGEAGARLAALPEDGRRYVIYNEAEGFAIAGEGPGGRLEAAAWEAQADCLPAPVPENALVLTAHAGEDGAFRFTAPDGRMLVCGPGGGLTLQAEPAGEAADLWWLEKACGGWYIVSAGAEGNKAIQYYSDCFSTYRLGRTGVFICNFYEIPGE